MTDVFISYARSTVISARRIADALRALGYDVWRDDELPAHRAFTDVIEEQLKSAKAVVVVWSAEAVSSEWVQSEADQARVARKLVQLSIDGAKPPMPFDRIQCADLVGWEGDRGASGWRTVAASVAALLGHPTGSRAAGRHTSAIDRTHAICVLPFANMSGDAEQEYFSDGISEDIITDLSKVSALSVVARNTAFTFKGRAVDVRQVARELNVSHVLEGSVRKSGGRVRITAQLIDGAAGDHIWAERFDRDLTDIFALQDEISEAIVRALKLKLLPGERQAIERRGTKSPEAYELYLMARRQLAVSNYGDAHAIDAILRLCRRAIEIDPNYAIAWALTAVVETSHHLVKGSPDDGLAAAERALLLDADLAEAHAVLARHRFRQGRFEEASSEIEAALRLDPESYEVNQSAGLLCFRQRRLAEAARYYEKATALTEFAFGDPGMLLSCYIGIGDVEAARRAARTTLDRARRALAQDHVNGSALGFGVSALATLGEAEDAKEWIRRALLVDPDNMNMRYNMACALGGPLKDEGGALELLGAFFATAQKNDLNHAKIDPDLDPLRGHPSFRAMAAGAEARLAAEGGPGK